jgi:hypothetical protein
MYMHTTGSTTLDIIIGVFRLLYGIYLISPIYIKILFWIIILICIAWFILSVIKIINNPTTTMPNV